MKIYFFVLRNFTQKGRMITVYGCSVPAGGHTRFEPCGASGTLASIKYSKSEAVRVEGNVRE
jgi:hypothetical protein